MPIPRTQSEILRELYQAVIGIPENPSDNGLIGKVEEVKGLVIKQNSRIAANEKSISRMKGAVAAACALAGLTGVAFTVVELVSRG